MCLSIDKYHQFRQCISSSEELTLNDNPQIMLVTLHSCLQLISIFGLYKYNNLVIAESTNWAVQ